jgi:hypothetical protein
MSKKVAQESLKSGDQKLLIHQENLTHPTVFFFFFLNIIYIMSWWGQSPIEELVGKYICLTS